MGGKCRRGIRPAPWTAVGVVGLLALALMPTVDAAVTGKTSLQAGDLATAMESLPGLVTGASFPQYASPGPTGPYPAGVADAVITPTFGVPAGTTFAILSSGNAAEADDPDTIGVFPSTGMGGTYNGANDVTILKVDIDVPPSDTCLSIDFQFVSEEYPDFVGSTFNDAFIAELDATTWTVSGGTVAAPDNFAFDAMGNPITINSASMTAGNAMGSPYGGGTALLNAMTPVTPGGTHSVFFTIFDASDSAYDSAVFLDDLFTFNAPSGVCIPGAKPPPEPPVVTMKSTVDGEWCVGDLIPITAAATWGTPGTPAWVDWDFGDGTTQKDNVTGTTASAPSTTHTYSVPGSYKIQIEVTDTMGLTDSASTFVYVDDCIVPNDPPVIDPIPVQHVTEGSLVKFKVSGYDPDDDDVVFSAPKLPQAGMKFDPASLLFTWTAGEAGVYSATFRITEVTPFLQYDETDAKIVVEPAPPAPETGDGDADGAVDGQDNCPFVHNPDQADSDGDGVGDACDATPGTPDLSGGPGDDEPGADLPGDNGLGLMGVRDTDRDGVTDGADNCPSVPNGDQVDRDRDGVGDLCDPDLDGDGVPQLDALGFLLDNCPFTVNAGQEDRDLDGIGDACQGDRDADGVPDGLDNCVWMPNPAQVDADGDGQGDACQDLGTALLPGGSTDVMPRLAHDPGRAPASPGQAASVPAGAFLAVGLGALVALVVGVVLLARRRGEGS